MHSVYYNVDRDVAEKNISEFTKRALDYGISYEIELREDGRVRATLKGYSLSKLAVLAGILMKND